MEETVATPDTIEEAAIAMFPLQNIKFALIYDYGISSIV